MKIEQEFNIEVLDQRWEQVVTVQDMYSVVEEYSGAGFINKNEMIEKINKVLIEHIGCNPEEIAPHKRLGSDLGLD